LVLSDNIDPNTWRPSENGAAVPADIGDLIDRAQRRGLSGDANGSTGAIQGRQSRVDFNSIFL